VTDAASSSASAAAAGPTAAQPPPPDSVTLTIDGMPVTVKKGTNVLEAARTLGIDISAFCYHPGLPVVAQCRQCLVSVEKNPKLQPSCQQTCGRAWWSTRPIRSRRWPASSSSSSRC